MTWCKQKKETATNRNGFIFIILYPFHFTLYSISYRSKAERSRDIR